jgi:hypothetical protein
MPQNDTDDDTPAEQFPEPLGEVLSAYRQLGAVPLSELDDDVSSQVFNALNELDSAILTAASKGQLQPASDE